VVILSRYSWKKSHEERIPQLPDETPCDVQPDRVFPFLQSIHPFPSLAESPRKCLHPLSEVIFTIVTSVRVNLALKSYHHRKMVQGSVLVILRRCHQEPDYARNRIPGIDFKANCNNINGKNESNGKQIQVPPQGIDFQREISTPPPIRRSTNPFGSTSSNVPSSFSI